MKRILYAICMGAALSAQSQNPHEAYHVSVSVKGKIATNQMVYIVSCSGNHSFRAIYRDSELKIPLANPVVPNLDGTIEFFISVYESVEGIKNFQELDKPLFGCLHAPPVDLTYIPPINLKTEPGVVATVQPNGDVDVAPKYCAGGAPSKNDPDCIPVYKAISPTSATIEIVGIGSLKCNGGQHIEGDGKSEIGNHCVDDLKCGKYQHVYHWPGRCGPSPCDENGGCEAICLPPPPDGCVDDIHEVTEREWQKLMDTIHDLETSLKEK